MSIYLAAISVLLAPAGAEQQQPTWKTLRAPYHLDVPGYQGEARIEIQPSRPRYGETVTVVSSFKNTFGHPVVLFKPTRSAFGIQSRRLALYDAQRNYVCDLLTYYSLSRVWGVQPDQWCQLEPGAVVTDQITRKNGHVMRPRVSPFPKRLPPGRYFVQMIYLDYFASPSPFEGAVAPCCETRSEDWRDRWGTANGVTYEESVEASQEWSQHVDGHEICRSNIVELRILPQPVAAPKP